MRKTIELNEQQLSCLASPVRADVFTTIRTLGNCAIGEIARALNRPADSLYYHVRALLNAGLVREVSQRPTRRKPEAVYAPAADDLRLPDLVAQPALAELSRKTVAAGLRQTMRKLDEAAKRAQEQKKPEEFLVVIRALPKLSMEDARTFLEMLEKVQEFAREHECPNGVKLHWMSVVFPTE